MVNNLVEWSAVQGLPQTASFRYSDSISSQTSAEDHQREAIWKTGTFDSFGQGLAEFDQLPLGLNLVQIEVNGEQVTSYCPIMPWTSVPA